MSTGNTQSLDYNSFEQGKDNTFLFNTQINTDKFYYLFLE